MAKPKPQAFGAVEAGAGQREELGEAAAKPRQIAPAADVREDSDRGLGHRQHRPLGRDAIAARAGDSDAAAHRHPVHEGDAGLGVGIFEVVQPIFVEEEGARGRFVAVDILGNADDVAAGAKAAALGMVDEDDPDVGIVAPFDQRRGHVADHLAAEAVERLGPVEPQAAGEALLVGQDVFFAHDRVHHGIIT